MSDYETLRSKLKPSWPRKSGVILSDFADSADVITPVLPQVWEKIGLSKDASLAPTVVYDQIRYQYTGNASKDAEYTHLVFAKVNGHACVFEVYSNVHGGKLSGQPTLHDAVAAE